MKKNLTPTEQIPVLGKMLPSLPSGLCFRLSVSAEMAPSLGGPGRRVRRPLCLTSVRNIIPPVRRRFRWLRDEPLAYHGNYENPLHVC